MDWDEDYAWWETFPGVQTETEALAELAATASDSYISLRAFLRGSQRRRKGQRPGKARKCQYRS